MKKSMRTGILGALLLTTALLGAGEADAALLYFPHVDTTYGWQTEIAIVNRSPHQSVAGTLRALSNTGQLVDTKPVILPGGGRRQINVADEFGNHSAIGYIVFDADADTIHGYTKFSQPGKYRVAIPAVKEVNTADIHITHIDSGPQWWTGLSLVNTTSAAKSISILFNDGQVRDVTLAANEHKAFSIGSLFGDQPQPSIRSGVITNAGGVIGLELFGTHDGRLLEGILLTDRTSATLYYPHVAGGDWWTGIVAYNPSDTACTVTVAPFSAAGVPLTPSTLTVPGKGKYVGAVTDLGLHAQTAWFKISSSLPLSGFELIGTTGMELLAGHVDIGGLGAKQGAFAKIEKDGWTTIALVNTENSGATVTLSAYADDGTFVAGAAFPMGSRAKVVDSAEALFPQSIARATYIAYASDRDMVGVQLNGSADGKMLDGLPGLGGGLNGGGQAAINTCADGSQCMSPLTCSPASECICPAGRQLCGHSCIPADASCCADGSYCESPGICASDNSCTSDGAGGGYAVNRHMFANVCAGGMIYGYTGPNYTICNMYLNTASNGCSKIINNCHGE